MLRGDQGTLVSQADGTFVNHATNPDYGGTMLQYGDGTMLNHGTMENNGEGTMLNHGDGTMINHGEGSLVQHKSGPGSAISRLVSCSSLLFSNSNYFRLSSLISISLFFIEALKIYLLSVAFGLYLLLPILDNLIHSLSKIAFIELYIRTLSGIESNLGTMVINEDEEEDSTMKQYGTAPGGSKYRSGRRL